MSFHQQLKLLLYQICSISPQQPSLLLSEVFQHLLSITMPPSRVSSATTGTDTWHQNERLIRRLYQDERQTLEQVKQTMETEYNFPQMP